MNAHISIVKTHPPPEKMNTLCYLFLRVLILDFGRATFVSHIVNQLCRLQVEGHKITRQQVLDAINHCRDQGLIDVRGSIESGNCKIHFLHTAKLALEEEEIARRNNKMSTTPSIHINGDAHFRDLNVNSTVSNVEVIIEAAEKLIDSVEDVTQSQKEDAKSIFRKIVDGGKAMTASLVQTAILAAMQALLNNINTPSS